LNWLGKKWEEVEKELVAKAFAFTSEITYPGNKITPCGDLRVVRISRNKGKWNFILLYDRFSK